MNAWMFLAIAIAFEVCGTLLLKLSNGFEKIALGMAAIACYSVCFWFFAPVLKIIPAGVAYAIWSGLGISLVTLISVMFLGDKLGFAQYGFIGMICIGAIGLNFTTQA